MYVRLLFAISLTLITSCFQDRFVCVAYRPKFLALLIDAVQLIVPFELNL